jgi:hypothetical protein
MTYTKENPEVKFLTVDKGFYWSQISFMNFFSLFMMAPMLITQSIYHVIDLGIFKNQPITLNPDQWLDLSVSMIFFCCGIFLVFIEIRHLFRLHRTYRRELALSINSQPKEKC